MATPSTPKRGSPTSDSTPARPHPTGSHDFHSVLLETVRQENLKDVGRSTPEVGLDLFLEHLLPPLKVEVSMNSAASFLTEQGVDIPDAPDAHGEKFKDFATDSANQDDREDKVFTSLGPIFDATICGAISSGCTNEQTFVLTLVPNIGPKSLRGNTNRPDAFFLLAILDFQ